MSGVERSDGSRISVVIRARCANGDVLRVLDAVASQTARPERVGVIDSGSADWVLEQLKRCRDRGLATMPAPGDESNGGIPLDLVQIAPEEYQSARALNRIIREMPTPLVAILSQDACPADDRYLERLASAFESGGVAGAYARQTPADPGDPMEEKDLARTYPERSRLQSAPDCWFVNTCSMIRRDLWKLHPFEERAVISEDHQWAKRVQERGFKIKYDASALVVHHHHHYDDLRGVWRRFYDEGRGLAYVHGGSPGIGRALLVAAREIASDGVWLAQRGRVHLFPRTVARRAMKHAALFCGFRQGARTSTRPEEAPQSRRVTVRLPAGDRT